MYREAYYDLKLFKLIYKVLLTHMKEEKIGFQVFELLVLACTKHNASETFTISWRNIILLRNSSI